MDTLTPTGTATCALARIDEPEPGRAQLTYSLAGHPPPILVAPDGACRTLGDAINPMLGIGRLIDQPYHSAALRFPPDHTLLLYTDGLIERPGENLKQGLGRLCDQARLLARQPLPAFCDGLLTNLPTTDTDDIAVIALRTSIPTRPTATRSQAHKA
jgi:serine phosphatase RsbU (regulator of sigma subunit)